MDADAYVAILRCSACIYDTLFIHVFTSVCLFLVIFGFLLHPRSMDLNQCLYIHEIARSWDTSGFRTASRIAGLTPPSLLLTLSTPSRRLSDIPTRPPTSVCIHCSGSASVSSPTATAEQLEFYYPFGP